MHTPRHAARLFWSVLPVLLAAGCDGAGLAGLTGAHDAISVLTVRSSDDAEASGTAPDPFASQAAPAAIEVATLHNPEPASVLLFGAGLLAAGAVARRRQHAARRARPR